jgi:predicted dehydrogenase
MEAPMTPLIIGTGRAGKAIAKSLAVVNILHPELGIKECVWLKRGAMLSDERKKYKQALLCVANPHGLHADAIHSADQAGFDAILCEKPACVNMEQLKKLKDVKTPTAILQVYRQTWGLQTLKKMIERQEFGELITIEGRYWHPSLAERALLSADRLTKSWKDDIRLSGEYDTYLDLGIHWLDAVCFLYSAFNPQIHGSRSYKNAAAAHRDSHVQVTVNFSKGRGAFGSISKTVHGSPNHFEINIIGSRKYAKWEFLTADEILVGEGRNRSIITRHDSELGSKQDPHHAMGWLEGYVEIAYQLFLHVLEGKKENYPTLNENLTLLQSMFETDWTQ